MSAPDDLLTAGWARVEGLGGGAPVGTGTPVRTVGHGATGGLRSHRMSVFTKDLRRCMPFEGVHKRCKNMSRRRNSY